METVLYFVNPDNLKEHLVSLKGEIERVYGYEDDTPTKKDIDYLVKVLFNIDSESDRVYIVKQYKRGNIVWS